MEISSHATSVTSIPQITIYAPGTFDSARKMATVIAAATDGTTAKPPTSAAPYARIRGQSRGNGSFCVLPCVLTLKVDMTEDSSKSACCSDNCLHIGGNALATASHCRYS